MSENLQKLRELREESTKEILRLRDVVTGENRDFTSEEQGAWDKANADLNRADRTIALMERAAEVEANFAKVQKRAEGDPAMPGAEDVIPEAKRRGKSKGEVARLVRGVAVSAWFLRGAGRKLTARQKRACQLVGLSPNSRHLDINLMPTRELRAQGVGTDSLGGYARPQGFVYSLEKALKDYAEVRQVADVMRTDTGAPLPWPTVNDTANSAGLLAENTTVGAAVDVTFGQTTFNAYKFSSGLVLVSSELDEDSAFDMDTVLAELLGERLGRGQAPYLTTGTGTSQPAGIVTGAALGKTGASATAIAADELIDLEHSVDPAYRRDPSCGWMMHDNILAAIRKLKDSQNRYLWQAGLQDGTPQKLLNYPVTVNLSMASAMATTAKTILFGAFKKFKVRDVGKVRVRRLVERYADLDQIGYVAFQRMDSKILNAGGNPIKYFAQL